MPRSSAHSALAAMLLFCLVLLAVANGAHAFPKRRVLLQDSSTSTSSSGGGDNGGTAGSSTSFSNIVSGAEDSPDRVEASPAVALAESPLSDAELCAVSKQIYGSVPPECANQPQIAVRTLPVKVGPVGEPLSLGVDEDGAITASGGNPPDVDAADWDPVAGQPLSQSSSSSSGKKKLSSGAVAGIVVGAVVAFVALVAAVAVSRKRRAARSVAGLAAARAGTSSSR